MESVSPVLVTGQFVAAPGDRRQLLPGRSSPVSLTGSDSGSSGSVPGGHVCLPVQLPHQHAWLSTCILAAYSSWCHGNPTQPGQDRSLGRAAGQLMPLIG